MLITQSKATECPDGRSLPVTCTMRSQTSMPDAGSCTAGMTGTWEAVPADACSVHGGWHTQNPIAGAVSRPPATLAVDWKLRPFSSRLDVIATHTLLLHARARAVVARRARGCGCTSAEGYVSRPGRLAEVWLRFDTPRGRVRSSARGGGWAPQWPPDRPNSVPGRLHHVRLAIVVIADAAMIL